MKIFIASDHAGYKLKQALIQDLEDGGHAVEDMGPETLDENDDYPIYIAKVAKAISEYEEANLENVIEFATDGVFGIVIGGSGQGEAIMANRFPHVRCALYYGGSSDIISLSREHNNANVLSLGARFLTEADAISAVRLWLGTNFSYEERHERRIAEIEKLAKEDLLY